MNTGVSGHEWPEGTRVTKPGYGYTGHERAALMTDDLTTADLLAEMPAHVLGLGAPDLSPETVRDRLAAVGRADPEAGHVLADELAHRALEMVADGYPRPAKLAADTLTVLTAEFPRWCA